MPVGLQFTGQIDTERKIVQIAQAFCAITTEIQQRRPPLRSSAS
jgi:Asp-tRNA(Asn)/Glu-tRNA(Gln) amidotransferase A subunit family amidase